MQLHSTCNSLQVAADHPHDELNRIWHIHEGRRVRSMVWHMSSASLFETEKGVHDAIVPMMGNQALPMMGN